jgi:hypothetical protein
MIAIDAINEIAYNGSNHIDRGACALPVEQRI